LGREYFSQKQNSIFKSEIVFFSKAKMQIYNDIVRFGYVADLAEIKKQIAYNNIIGGKYIINTHISLKGKIPDCPVRYFTDKQLAELPPIGASFITENLFVGSYRDAKNMPFLKYFKIEKCINLSGLENANNLPTLQIKINDLPTENIKQYFDICRSYAAGKTLIYCMEGISRSATICAAILMQNHDFEKSMEILHAARNIKPNSGFMEQLKM